MLKRFKQSETTNYSKEDNSESQYSTSQKNYQNLSQKQIIHELKCLVARQEQTIDCLVTQIQALKRDKSEQILGKFSFSKDYNQQQKQQQRQNENQELRIELNQVKQQYSDLKLCIDSFVKKSLNFHLQRVSINDTQAMSESFPSKSNEIPRISTGALKSKQKIPKSRTDNNKQYYVQIIGKMEKLLQTMQSKLNKGQADERRLQAQYSQNQANLQELLKQYQNSIVQSESIETKLIEEIQRLTAQLDKLGKSSSEKFRQFYH